MKRGTLLRYTLFPALFAALIAIVSNTPMSRGAAPATYSYIPTIYSQAIGATSRNGHYLNGDPADTLQAGLTASSQTETTSVISIWGARQICMVLRDSVPNGSFVDSAQVSYSLSWDGVASGTNWTQPRTIKSASYATWKPSIPDTFQIAERGILDTTVAIKANALTAGGYVPTWFSWHVDSTTVSSQPHYFMYPYMRFIITPKARIRGCVAAGCGVLTINAPLVGLRMRVHVIKEWIEPTIYNAYK